MKKHLAQGVRAPGVATSGVMIYNGISGEGVDPFYPAAYGDVTDPIDT
jgi:hypothetical protein